MQNMMHRASLIFSGVYVTPLLLGSAQGLRLQFQEKAVRGILFDRQNV